MTLPILYVLIIAIIAMVLFMTERVRIDAIAMLVLASLSLLGLVDAKQALSGFSNEATITVASMFILAAALENSGALSGISRFLGKAKSPFTFLLTLFALLAVIAPFVNNTAVVAVFIPIVITASLRIGLSPSKSLIPLSYVAQFTGVCTLIGTSTNLIVNSIARDLGHQGFSMFEFLPLGAICFVAGCLYLLFIGRWLLPDVKSSDLGNLYEFGHYITEIYIPENSSLVGSSFEEENLGENYGIYIMEVLRDKQAIDSPRSSELQAGDVLLVRGNWADIEKLTEDKAVKINNQLQFGKKMPEDVKWVLTEVMIAPNSGAAGRRLVLFNRTWKHNTFIMGIQRRGQVIRSKLDQVRLKIGDILMVAIPEEDLKALKRDRSVVILSAHHARTGKRWKGLLALAIMAAVIFVAAVGIMPIAISALVGAVAVTMIGCIQANEVYDATDWSIVILMAGLLPLGIAMSQTGAAEFIVDNTIGLVKDFGPHIVLAVVYLMALFLGELMSNSAAAVLLTPIGISTASMMDTSATPFLIAITFSASTSFLTPVGYQTNTMVYSAGGYKFTDFIKVGLPLNLLFWVLGVIFIPVFWPF